ncbi:hypothetical protein M405DRAFT_890518, partial [Rhizopogon salebrosus TDB-379]
MTQHVSFADHVDYQSDHPAENEDTEYEADVEEADSIANTKQKMAASSRKRQKLDVPYREQRKQLRIRQLEEKTRALTDLEKLLKSKKTTFVGGEQGLQARRAHAIASHLRMVVQNGRQWTDASERSAETHGFAVKWGGRQLRGWSVHWLQTRELPKSLKGQHAKVYSLLSNPTVAAELRAYVRSNKWAVNPAKLAQFARNQLIDTAADQYLHHIIQEEMPRGLKQYMEIELFPRIHLKVGRGISLSTARRWLHLEANDSCEKSWVLGDEHMLRKKGAGRGLHQSDVICSTIGWLEGASQTIEYGKNYDGYWTGELFVKQLTEKIIPAFEQAHGPGYQALFMVNNSQGHSAYAEDALLVSRMNVKPGGKQARMHDGWFMRDGHKISQPMIFPCDHSAFPNEPKGIKVILTE